ncbi:MAG: flavin reductase family protein [Oscillospiraceae bacterium]|nr:flavin reductase family protein [Oscillospiraceae bacterium]
MAFIEKDISKLQCNPFDLISKDWFLLTSGNLENYNTMTCSWGAMGVIWNQPSLTAYVRSSRYTYDYLEKNNLFTVSVFSEAYRKALAFCGSHSGRDCDKAKETGLIPVALNGCVSFAQAKVVFVCEKTYAQDMQAENFLEKENVSKFYASDAMHKLYIGKILAIYENDD